MKIIPAGALMINRRREKIRKENDPEIHGIIEFVCFIRARHEVNVIYTILIEMR